jgi:hypothetical protein
MDDDLDSIGILSPAEGGATLDPSRSAPVQSVATSDHTGKGRSRLARTRCYLPLSVGRCQQQHCALAILRACLIPIFLQNEYCSTFVSI